MSLNIPNIKKCGYAACNYIADAINAIIDVPAGVGEVVSASTSTLSGILGTSLSILSFGKIHRYHSTATLTKKAYKILPLIIAIPLKVLNIKTLDALKDKSRLHEKKCGYFRWKCHLFDFACPCLKTMKTNYKLWDRGIKWMNDYSSITFRILYPLSAIIATVARVVDFAFGLLALTASILTFGRFPNINELAIVQLTLLGAIDDISIGLRGFVNPHQCCL